MDVAFLCHPFHRGGVTKWMIEAAEECARRGSKIWFITVQPLRFISGKNRATMFDSLRSIEGINLIASNENKSFELGTLRYRSLLYSLSIINHVPLGIPVILSDDESIWLAGKFISKSYPIIGVLHSDDIAYYNLCQKYNSYFSGIIAVSDRIKNIANKLIGKDIIQVIPCGIQLPQLIKKMNNNILKILWAGRIEERSKRISDIPKISKKLLSNRIPFHWTIAGHGDFNTIKKDITKLKLEKHFTYTGWIDSLELYRIMDYSDLLVLTSNFEGMPVIVMEALAKGLGVVSTRVSGVEDLVQDNLAKDAIRLYEIGNVKQAVDLIKDIMEIPKERRVSAARKLAEKYYSIQSCIDQYDEVIGNMHFTPSTTKIRAIKFWLFIEKIKSFFIANIRYWKYKLMQSV